ncbi:hypothetical protein H4Q26_009161 [Puccinia striiformis f. sp. tritici PST-130]|nr:hypothetical protein H4Q26_009161 [Puccinia striiformis f. sp. tritici PST-130]
MTKHLAKRSVLSPTPIMRWCQQRLHRFRPSGTSEQVRYLTRTEKRADQDLISPPHSPRRGTSFLPITFPPRPGSLISPPTGNALWAPRTRSSEVTTSNQTKIKPGGTSSSLKNPNLNRPMKPLFFLVGP